MFEFIPKIVFYTSDNASFYIGTTNYGFSYWEGFIWVTGISKSVGGAYYQTSSSSPQQLYNYFNLIDKKLVFYGETKTSSGNNQRHTAVNETN